MININALISKLKQNDLSQIDELESFLRSIIKMEDEISESMFNDKRTLSHPSHSPKNDYYYDGIYDTYKIVKKYTNNLSDL